MGRGMEGVIRHEGGWVGKSDAQGGGQMQAGRASKGGWRGALSTQAWDGVRKRCEGLCGPGAGGCRIWSKPPLGLPTAPKLLVCHVRFSSPLVSQTSSIWAQCDCQPLCPQLRSNREHCESLNHAEPDDACFAVTLNSLMHAQAIRLALFYTPAAHQCSSADAQFPCG